jgi:Sulfotransferase family
VPDTGPLRPAPVHGPVFIIGAMGSGSTLLRLILDSHDNIAIPRETGFMRAYNAHQFIPYKWSGRNWAKRMGWSRKELDEELAHFYDRIFMRNVERQGKQRWGDKTPYHTWHIDDMARLFPEAVFIGIVRHPGACVSSNMNRWGHTVTQAAYHRARYNREIARQAAQVGECFAIVRYEDLVLRPETLLRELLDWLGEPWSPSVLEHHTVQGARGGRVNVEGRSRVDEPIDTSRIAKWTKTMGEGQRAVVRRRLGALGAFYGYDVDDAAALAPLREGSLIAAGPDIDARIERHGQLDLRAQGTVPVADRLYDPRKVGIRTHAALAEMTRAPKPSAQRRAALAVWTRVPERLRSPIRRAVRRARALTR